MRIRLVSVVGEFLWSGERPVDDDVQCFPGGHSYPPGVLFRVRGHRNNACSRVDYTETCTSLGPTCRVGGRPAGGKDPVAHS